MGFDLEVLFYIIFFLHCFRFETIKSQIPTNLLKISFLIYQVYSQAIIPGFFMTTDESPLAKVRK